MGGTDERPCEHASLRWVGRMRGHASMRASMELQQLTTPRHIRGRARTTTTSTLLEQPSWRTTTTAKQHPPTHNLHNDCSVHTAVRWGYALPVKSGAGPTFTISGHHSSHKGPNRGKRGGMARLLPGRKTGVLGQGTGP